MKIKTKHIITCIKCLFLGLVMALPFIAVLPTALYYGFNEHAQSGDKVEYIPTNKVVDHEDLIIGNEYYINGIDKTPFQAIIYDYIDDSGLDIELEFNSKIIDLEEQYQIDENITEEITYNYNTYISGYLIDDEIQINAYYYYKTNIMNYAVNVISLQFTTARQTYILTQQIKNLLTYVVENNLYLTYEEIIEECPQEYRTIKSVETNINNQNALEIAFNNVFTTKGFNWVSNSIIATPIYAFVGAFGLTNDLFISNLIVYWTNILLIYAILNIVLVVFTKLTQLGKKKEED